MTRVSDLIAGKNQDAVLGSDIQRLNSAAEQDIQPNEAARVLSLQMKTGLPADLIRRNLDDIERQAKRNDFDAEKYKRETPAFAEWAAEHPYHLSVAGDDYENLSKIELFLASREEGQHEVEMNKLWLKRGLGTATPEEIKATEEAKTREGPGKFGTSRWEFDRFIVEAGRQEPQLEGGIKKGVGLGAFFATGLGLTAAAIPGGQPAIPAAAGVGGSAGFMAGIVTHAYEQERGAAFMEFSQVRDMTTGQPIDEGIAWAASGLVGVVNAGLEATGLGMILRNVPVAGSILKLVSKDSVKKALQSATVRQALGRFATGVGMSVGGEMTTEFFQEVSNIAVGELMKSVAPGDYEKISGEEAAARLAEIVETTFKATLLLGSAGPTAQLGMDLHRVNKARKQINAFKALGEGAQASKLRENLPGKFRDFVAKVREKGGVESIRIPADRFVSYFQDQGLDPEEVATEIMGSPEALRLALAHGGDLAVPLEDYASHLAATPHHAGLINDLRLHEDDMTMREAEYWQSHGDEVVAALREGFPADQLKPANQEIMDALIPQLLSTGTERSVAENQAAQMAAVYATQAEVMGMDPIELFNRTFAGVKSDTPASVKKAGVDTVLDPMIDRVRSGDIPTSQDVYGPSLAEFLKENGGLQDQGGELSARDAAKTIRGLIKSGGLTLDGAAELAHDAGYISAKTEQGLLDALDRELAGKPVHTLQNANQEVAELQAALNELADYLDKSGIDINTLDNEQIKKLLIDDQGMVLDQEETSGISDRQDFGDIMITQSMDLAGRGEVKITRSAQTAFDREVKRRNGLESLLRCLNGNA